MWSFLLQRWQGIERATAVRAASRAWKCRLTWTKTAIFAKSGVQRYADVLREEASFGARRGESEAEGLQLQPGGLQPESLPASSSLIPAAAEPPLGLFVSPAAPRSASQSRPH